MPVALRLTFDIPVSPTRPVHRTQPIESLAGLAKPLNPSDQKIIQSL